MRKLIGIVISAGVLIAAIQRCDGHINDNNSTNSTHIKCIDTFKIWNGFPVVELYMIKGHEYIITRAGTTDGGVHIIHAESCPCKQK